MLDICDFKSTHNRKEVGVSFLEFSFLGGGVVFIALLWLFSTLIMTFISLVHEIETNTYTILDLQQLWT